MYIKIDKKNYKFTCKIWFKQKRLSIENCQFKKS